MTEFRLYVPREITEQDRRIGDAHPMQPVSLGLLLRQKPSPQQRKQQFVVVVAAAAADAAAAAAAVNFVRTHVGRGP